jgi:cold shock CspA family protein/ribosome-associated translation inhibitor RaiA
MAAPISVTYHRFDAPDHVREKINALVAQLDKFDDAITDGRVVVEGAHRHGTKTVLEIRVELSVKGRRIVGKRSAEYPAPAGQRTFVKAATEAFHVVQRQLKEHQDKLAGHETKSLQHQRERGRVLSLDRDVGTGFVEMPDGASLFFSADVVKDDAYASLAEGDTVLVTIAESEGAYGPQASSVDPEAPEVRSR